MSKLSLSFDHQYARAGQGEQFVDEPPLTKKQREIIVARTAESPLDTATHKLVTRVHRVDVDSTRYDESTGILHMPLFMREIVGVEFFKGSFPRHKYAVNGGTFTIAVSGTDYTATVVAGQYTATTFAAHIQSIVRTVTSDANFTCTYDATTEKFTIASNTVATFTLQFTTAMIGYTLGFGHNTYDYTTSPPTKIKLTDTVFPTSGAATSVVSPFTADLAGPRYVEMSSETLIPYYINDNALIDTVHVVDDINIDAGNDREPRTFRQAIPHVKVLPVKLMVRLPTGEKEIYDPMQRAFHLTFRIFTLDMQKLRREPLYR